VSTKDTHRERRRSVAVRHSQERATKSTPFRFFATKATKRERDIRATERASSYTLTFLVRFCFPAEILFADRRNSYARKKERKKERTIEVYSSLLLSSRRLYRPHELREICRLRECIARAVLSVSRSYSSRDSERRRDSNSI